MFCGFVLSIKLTFSSIQGPISLGRVLDKLKDDLQSIVESPELIHDENVIMTMFDEWKEELPDFKDYMFHQFNLKKQQRVKESDSWAIPLLELRRELFYPKDSDNKGSCGLLEKLAKIAGQAWIRELLDPKKGNQSIFV